MTSLKSENHRFRRIAALVTLCCYLYYKLTDVLYLDIDNFYVSVITAGLFGDNNWGFYIHPLLCYGIK